MSPSRILWFLRVALATQLVVVLSGCSVLLPGKKEFFQKEVPVYPAQSFKELEALRQAASVAKESAAETLIAAEAEGASPEVIGPARDAAVLTDAVSAGVGPSLKPAKGEAKDLAGAVLRATAEHNRDLDKLKDRLRPLEGKDVEGTGLIQVGYFALLGGVLLIGFFAYIVLRAIVSVAAISNPAVAVGSGVAGGVLKIGGRVVTKGFAQMMKGGEEFKNAIEAQLEPQVAELVKTVFRKSHESVQDEEVQTAIKAATAAMKSKN